jgi:hypothetical protein
MYRPSSQAGYSFDPVYASLTLSGPGDLSFSDSLAWDPSTALFKTNTATFAWGALSAALEAKRGYYYSLNPLDLGAGWQQVGSEAFVVSGFKAAFKKTWKTADSAAWRASLSVDASYNQSLLQFSDSVLGLTLGLTLKINDFLDLSFSSISQNASAWRYCPWLFPAVYDIGDPSAWFKNPVTDIADSFAFWDKALRTASLFKLKSLSVSLVHDLHDWDLSFTLSASPVLDTTAKAYSLDSTFTILLRWKDLQQIKSTLTKSSSGYSF